MGGSRSTAWPLNGCGRCRGRRNEVEDVLNLKKKVDAGAEHLISQLFFDNAVFYRFLERTKIAGISVPIEAGIMPVTNKNQIERMVSLCGRGLYTIIIGWQEPSLYLARNCENNIVTLWCLVIVPLCLNPSNSSWCSILLQTVLYDSSIIVIYSLEISCIHVRCQYEEPHILFRCGIAACLIYINHVFTL